MRGVKIRKIKHEGVKYVFIKDELEDVWDAYICDKELHFKGQIATHKKDSSALLNMFLRGLYKKPS